jgi:hypothetical protein
MKCEICKCSNERPCDPPCAWEEANICSSCAATIRALTAWWEGAYRPSLSALLRSFKYYRESAFRTLSAQARGTRR